MSAVLCKLGGMLVLMEARPSKPGSYFRRCPGCGSTGATFREYQGWTECMNDCSFAVLTSDYERVMREPPDGLTGEALPNIIPRKAHA